MFFRRLFWGRRKSFKSFKIILRTIANSPVLCYTNTV